VPERQLIAHCGRLSSFFCTPQDAMPEGMTAAKKNESIILSSGNHRQYAEFAVNNNHCYDWFKKRIYPH
jgi:hypothetical protein